MIKRGTAQLISVLLNPVFVAVAILIIALFTTPINQKIQWTTMVLVLNLVVPILLFGLLSRSGFAIDDTLANSRVKRDRLYIIAPIFFIGIVQWYLAEDQKIGQPFIATLASVTLLTGFVAFISYGWKISHHLTMISALIFITEIIFGYTVLWLLGLLPISAWARRELNRHTPRQIIAGVLLAPAIIIPVFYFYGLIV